MPKSTDPLKDNIIYTSRVPVRWERVLLDSISRSISSINFSNDTFLRVLLTLDDTPKDIDEADHEHMQSIQRIESKLNLMMEWMGQWLIATQGLPEQYDIQMSGSGLGITLPTSDTVSVGDRYILHVYLNKQIPQAIRLPCEIISVEQSQQKQDVVVTYTDLSDEICDLIEKFIFREHRRCIAAQKRDDITESTTD